MPSRRRGPRLVVAVAIATVTMLALGAATRLDPIPFGLHAEQVDHTERLTGAVCPLREGSYVFAAAGAPASIVIDGQPIVGPIHLTAGAHAILIEYPGENGATPLTLLWA